METWRRPVLTGPTLRPDDRLLQSPHPEEKQQERAPLQIYPILFLEIQPRSQRQRGRHLATLGPNSGEQVWVVQRVGRCLRLARSSSSSGVWAHYVLVGTPPPPEARQHGRTYMGSQTGLASAEASALHSLACDVPHSGWLKPWAGAGQEKGAGTQKGLRADLPTLRGAAAGPQSNDRPGRSRVGTTWVTWPLGTPIAPNLGELFTAWLVAEKALQ